MKYNHIQFTVLDQIGYLTLSRPSVNALNRAMVKEITQCAEFIVSESNISALIVQSNQKHFCAGADLKERERIPVEQVAEVVSEIGKMNLAIEKLPMPTIAAINGSALGGGAELALSCDLRMLAETAKIGFTETSLGIIPGAGGTQRLTRVIGYSKALYWISSARIFDAEEAFGDGVADFLAPADELLDIVTELANEFTENAPLALRAAKGAISEGFDESLTNALKIESKWYEKIIQTKDRLEGIRAFKEKRKPKWGGN